MGGKEGGIDYSLVGTKIAFGVIETLREFWCWLQSVENLVLTRLLIETTCLFHCKIEAVVMFL